MTAEMEALLRQQLRADPASADARLKLLEYFFGIDHKIEFRREAEALARSVADKKNSKQWQKAARMGRSLLPEVPLFHQDIDDSIELIEPPAAGEQGKAHQRFGENQAPYFEKLAVECHTIRHDAEFLDQLDAELTHVANRPSSLQHAVRLSQADGGAQIFFKREDLSPANTHLLLSVVGQALLAQRLGRKTLVSASANGLRGVLTASVAARMGLNAVIYMDEPQAKLQASNVFRMSLMGASVIALDPDNYDKLDLRVSALEHCLRDASSFLVMGLDAAPFPYPMMGLEFEAAIGRETRRQLRQHPHLALAVLVARGGSNADAIGFFQPFLPDQNVRLVCVTTRAELAQSARRPTAAAPFRQSSTSERQRASTIMEGLEHPSVIREHAWLRASGRVEYVDISEDAVKQTIEDCARYEGLILPIQTAHAITWGREAARQLKPEQAVVIILREGLDKDIWEIGKAMGKAL